MTASTDGRKLPVAKILTWVLTTAAGALIGILLKYFWEAPRPVIELLTQCIDRPGTSRSQ